MHLPRGRELQRERGDALAFGVLCVVAFSYLMWRGAGNNFFYDEWSWIEGRAGGLNSILSSYNEHLLAVPTALYQLLFRTAGLGHYWVYRAFEALAHIGCAIAVFAFARRRIGRWALLLAFPILFLGVAWEYVLQGVNFGFVASIGLSVLSLLMLDVDDQRGRAAACVLLVVALACSEFALPFILGIAVETVWRQRGLRHSWVWAIPLALYAVWWLRYHGPTQAQHNLTAAPAYALDLAANAVAGVLGLSLDWGRPLLIVAIGLLCWRVRVARLLTPRLMMLLVAAGSFWLLVALGRVQLGEPSAPRYVYTGAVFVILIAAETLRGVRLTLPALSLASLVLLFALAGNTKALSNGEVTLRDSSRLVSAELAALELSRHTAPPSLVLDQHYAPQLISGPYLAATRFLESTAGDSLERLRRRPEDARLAADGVLERALDLQVIAGAQSASATAPTPIVERATLGTTRRHGSCVEYLPSGPGSELDVLLASGSVQLKAAVGAPATAGAPVALRARRFASGFAADPLATVAGGQSVLIRAAADGSSAAWHLRVSPRSPVTVCGL